MQGVDHVSEKMTKDSPRRWFLTGICAETKSSYWYSANEILDSRPISEIFEILNTHYSKPEDAIKLLKKGNIDFLAPSFGKCRFSDENVSFYPKPSPGSIQSYDIHNEEERRLAQDKIVFIEFRGFGGWTCEFEEKMDEPTEEVPSALVAESIQKSGEYQLQLF